MKIKNVENEVKNNYPTQDDVSKKTLKKSIPKKWKILGISTLATILIGGVGIKLLYDKATETINTGVSGMYDTSIQIFNEKFENYVGKQNGSIVKALITKVKVNNVNSEAEELISINGQYAYDDLEEQRKAIIVDNIYTVEFSYNEETHLINAITIK